MRRSLIGIAFMLIGVFCSAVSVMKAMEMQSVWRDTATCSIDARTPADLGMLAFSYPDIKWTAYTQSAAQEVKHAEISNRMDAVPILTYTGDPTRIAFLPLVSGRLPLNGERGVCAIDERTAYRLFGSDDPAEASIRIDSKLLRVTGVVSAKSSFVLTPVNEESKLDRLATDNRGILDTLTSALGIEPDPYELSGDEIVKLLRFVCAVPWLITIMILLLRQRKRGGAGRIVGTILLLMLILSVVLMLVSCLPARLLPTRWSDLAFYGKQVAAFHARSFRAPDIRDKLIYTDVQHTVMLNIIASITLGIGMSLARRSANQ